MAFLKLYKYKSYLKLKNFFYILPSTKILNFKRPKWKKLQNQIKKVKKNFFLNKKKTFQQRLTTKSQNIIQILNNIQNLNVDYRSTPYYPQHKYVYCYTLKRAYVKYFFKLSIELKNFLRLFFDNNISITYYKKLLLKKFETKENIFLEIFLRPFFILEILLWKLGIFKSKQQIKQSLLFQKIKINNKIIFTTTVLKAGDIITICSTVKLSKVTNFPTFLGLICEIDYYNNSVILLRDYETINKDILLHLYPELLNYPLLLDYIKTRHN